MQAILTKFLPPTDHKPAMVKAYAEAGSVTLNWEHGWDAEDNHRTAVLRLIDKMGWDFVPVMGATSEGYAAVNLKEPPMMDDCRQDKTVPQGYVVATDAFLSGWGPARGGKSIFAVAYHDEREAEAIEIAMRGRSEMKRVRRVTTLDAQGLPRTGGPGDHVSVRDRGDAEEFYKGAAARWSA